LSGNELGQLVDMSHAGRPNLNDECGLMNIAITSGYSGSALPGIFFLFRPFYGLNALRN
jgi:hypothetical protein